MKRLRLIAILFAVLLVGWLGWLYDQSREPRYQGLTLTQWLVYNETLAQSMSFSTNWQNQYKASTHAIRQIGTNAIPFLLKKLSAKDSALQRRLRLWVKEQSLIQFDFPDPTMERTIARNGFSILGKDALSAVPALDKLTKHPNVDVRELALESLRSINPKPETLLPILLHAFHDPDQGIQIKSGSMLAELFPEAAERTGVYKEFPWLKHSSTNTVPNRAELLDK